MPSTPPSSKTAPRLTASPPTAPWIALAERELRSAGHRSSAPRSTVLELIARQDCVLTAQEIAERLRADRRRVGIATVYRTLEALDELGLVRRLDVGGAPARYEPSLPNGADHHHHMLCTSCGRAFPFEDGALEAAIDSVAARLDHTVEEHDVVLTGTCRECA